MQYNITKVDPPKDEIAEMIAQMLAHQMKAIVNRNAIYHARKVVENKNLVAELANVEQGEFTIQVNYQFDLTSTAILAGLSLILPSPKGTAQCGKRI